MNQRSNNSKVLIIGWDGGSFKVLDMMIAQGLMPHLASLITQGVRADFMSTIPPITAPAWTTFRTGKRPDNHGIYSFFKPPRDSLSRHTIERHNARSIHTPSFWNILNQQGKKVSVIDMPFTDPVERIDGIMVSGMLTRGKRGVLTYPEDLGMQLNNVFPHYPGKALTDGLDVSLAFLDHLIASLEWKKDIDLYLMQAYAWDCFATVFSAVDLVQHYYWKYIDHTSLRFQNNKKFREKIELFYQRLDAALGTYMNHIGEEATIFIVSDHGFGPANYTIQVNNILEEYHYLTINHAQGTIKKVFTQNSLKKILKALDVFHMRTMIKKEAREHIKKTFDYTVAVQWPHTQAYFRTTCEEGIYINKKAVFNDGVVSGDDYEKVMNELVRILASVQNSMTGELVFEFVKDRKAVYRGAFVDHAPDIIFRPASGYVCKGYAYGAKTVVPCDDAFLSGTHRPEGIFIAKGIPFNKNQCVDTFTIEDFVPQLLYSMNVPIPAGLDGSIQRSLFTDSFLKNHVPEYKSYPTKNGSYSAKELSNDERARVFEQLANLGYIE